MGVLHDPWMKDCTTIDQNISVKISQIPYHLVHISNSAKDIKRSLVPTDKT
jgi:hypothetical protein